MKTLEKALSAVLVMTIIISAVSSWRANSASVSMEQQPETSVAAAIPAISLLDFVNGPDPDAIEDATPVESAEPESPEPEEPTEVVEAVEETTLQAENPADVPAEIAPVEPAAEPQPTDPEKTAAVIPVEVVSSVEATVAIVEETIEEPDPPAEEPKGEKLRGAIPAADIASVDGQLLLCLSSKSAGLYRYGTAQSYCVAMRGEEIGSVRSVTIDGEDVSVIVVDNEHSDFSFVGDTDDNPLFYGELVIH